MTIEAIVAIGNQGQIGLNGELPWHDPDDLKWFRDVTMGKVCIVGYNTAQTLPDLPGRVVFPDCVTVTPDVIANSYIAEGRGLIVIGGAKTYQRWAPYITRWHIGRIDYDGPCDAVFDPMWVLTLPSPSAKVTK